MRTAEERIKDHARALGFALAGIARAGEADGFGRLQEWLARGYAGEMAYMGRYAAERRHPAAVLPDVRTVLMVGMEYAASRGRQPPEPPGVYAPGSPASGKIARYAVGPDYHDVLRDRLTQLL